MIGVEGVDGTKAISNHVIEVEKVLGIEAARITIINEIRDTMQDHGIYINNWPIESVFTLHGEVVGSILSDF